MRAVVKRVRQQADGLRRMLPYLLQPDIEEIVRSCQGRQLPAG